MSSATQAQKSWSRQQRERGNGYYRTAAGDNLEPLLKRARLESALRCYEGALYSSTDRDETVSAAKNVAMTAWKLASLHSSLGDTDWTVKKVLVERYYRQAVEHFTLAYQKEGASKSADWLSHLLVSWEQCSEEIMEWVNNLPEEDGEKGGENTRQEKIDIIGVLVRYLPDTVVKSQICLQLATDLFHNGVCACQNEQYMECYRLMKECYFPLGEAERLCQGDEAVLSEVQVLREDVYLHTCIAETGKARATGDALLEKVMKDEDELNVDLVWDIIDHYKQAAILCKTNDLEQEAVAYSRLARVYDKVLGLSVRAKDCAKEAIELALSMSPRNFHGVDWFEESAKVVEAFQRRVNKEGEENKEKDEALAEMKEDVDELKKLFNDLTSVEEFVKAVYEKWPPKAPRATFKEGLSKKKLLIRAISHYHPDKVRKEEHGKKWYYFTAEITKQLNERYEREKSSDSD